MRPDLKYFVVDQRSVECLIGPYNCGTDLLATRQKICKAACSFVKASLLFSTSVILKRKPEYEKLKKYLTLLSPHSEPSYTLNVRPIIVRLQFPSSCSTG